LLACLVAGVAGCGDDDDGGGVAANALSQCGVDKLEALAAYCDAYFAADASAAELAQARVDLDTAWGDAEAAAQAQGLSCSDLALTTQQAVDRIDDTRDVLAAAAGGPPNGTDCVGEFFAAAGGMCDASLDAEARYLVEQGSGGAVNNRNERHESARRDFLAESDEALADGCVAGEDQVRMVSNAARAQLDSLVDDLSFAVVAAANLDQDEYITLSPTGTVEYEGRGLTPVCMNGSPYHFFARRGSVNKLVMYYQGGGACWDKLTCSFPSCDTDVDPDGGDNPNNRSSGFADLSNPANPFRDWHSVFVSYCGCDIHFGDAEQDYVVGPGDSEPLHVEHRGYHNAKVVEKWAREHFLAPDEVFVTGSSAGAYGAWFNAPLLHDVWPSAQFHVLADAGNGVITQSFLENEFLNWNFEANLPPDLPSVQEVFDAGTGIPGYTEVIADEFPDTNWAHYTTAFDGGTGGQTGFYNIMLNENPAIVTGAGGGIGEAYARALHAEGASVVIAELNAEAGQRVARRPGRPALFVRTDVGDPASTDAMAEATMEAFGAASTIWSTTPPSSATWSSPGSLPTSTTTTSTGLRIVGAPRARPTAASCAPCSATGASPRLDRARRAGGSRPARAAGRAAAAAPAARRGRPPRGGDVDSTPLIRGSSLHGPAAR
jgi:hypothetical protein